MVFKLVRVDTVDPCKIQLPVGTHLFGRKAFLDCEDKRVSRSHGQLEVTADTVVLKALHQNPCFYKRKATDEAMTLKQNCITNLSHGDKFGLLPNSFWYELLLCHDLSSDTQNSAPNLQENKAADPVDGNKDDDMDATVSETLTNVNKDQELDKDDQEMLDFDMNETVGSAGCNESQSLISDQNQELAISEDPQPSVAPSTTEQTQPSSPGPSTPIKRAHSSDDAGYDAETPKKVKTEPQDDAGSNNGGIQAGPSSSASVQVKQEPPATPVKPPRSPAPPAPAPAPTRERCMYGASCYRKNPQHKAQFSHPHDADWGSGPRVPCPYGAQCRRRDPRHHRDHDHPPGVPPAHQPGQGRTKKARRKRDSSSDSSREVSPNPDLKLPAKRPRKPMKRQSWSGSESDNEYDMEDPFLTDGSEDDWKPESSDLNTQTQSQDL